MVIALSGLEPLFDDNSGLYQAGDDEDTEGENAEGESRDDDSAFENDPEHAR